MIKINLVKNFDSKAFIFFQRSGKRVFFHNSFCATRRRRNPYVEFKNYCIVLFKPAKLKKGLTFSHHHKKVCPTYFVRAYNLFKRKNFSLLFNSAADDNESSCSRCHVLFFYRILITQEIIKSRSASRMFGLVKRISKTLAIGFSFQFF